MSDYSSKEFLNEQTAVHGESLVAEEPSLLALESVVAPISQAALMQRAFLHVEKKEFAEAKQALSLVLDKWPKSAEALSLLGTISLLTDQPRVALVHLSHAADLQPTWAEVRKLCGEAAWRLGQPEVAATYLKSALKLKPDSPEIITRLGEAELRIGELKEGWAHYESRWEIASYRDTKPPIRLPMWDGKESLAGKTIVVFAEQRLNDLIQFVRYAEPLQRLGAKVIVTCPIDLRTLIETVPGVTRAIGFGEPLPPADLQVPMMSLPHLLDTTIGTVPAPQQYLRADPGLRKTWQEFLIQTEPTKKRFGLLWTGYPGENLAARHTLPLGDLRVLWDLPDITFFSLVIGDAVRDIREYGAPLIDLSSQLNSADDFAAVVAELDGIITIDTAVAHLAAAQGKAVYMLLDAACHFRWTGVSSQSPWYPSAQLFRQADEGVWMAPVQRLFRALGGRSDANPFMFGS